MIRSSELHSNYNIRQYRLKRRMTQEQLAEAAGLSPSYISQIESGRKNIGMEGLNKVATALDLPIEQLFINVKQSPSVYMEYAFREILSDCNPRELKIMLDTITQLKKSLRESSFD